MTLLETPRRSMTNGPTREHSGIIDDVWDRPQWESTPVTLSLGHLTLRNTFAQFSDAFDSFREHDVIRVVTTRDDHFPLLASVPRSIEPSTWFFVNAHEPGTGISDALATFDQLRTDLGLGLTAMCQAAGVPRRTYYSWRRGDVAAPRLKTVQGLWELADVVGQLRTAVHGPILLWLRSSAARRELLVARDFDRLLDDAHRIPERSTRSVNEFEPNGILYDVAVPRDQGPVGDIYEVGETDW